MSSPRLPARLTTWMSDTSMACPDPYAVAALTLRRPTAQSSAWSLALPPRYLIVIVSCATLLAQLASRWVFHRSRHHLEECCFPARLPCRIRRACRASSSYSLPTRVQPRQPACLVHRGFSWRCRHVHHRTRRQHQPPSA